MAKTKQNTYILIWAPEGRPIAEVVAKDAKSAKKQTPMPYKKHLGEVSVELKGDESWREVHGCLPLAAAIALGEWTV